MYCTQCGTLNADDANYCMKCGRATGGSAGLRVVTSSIYAGIWLRVGASLIDQAILWSAALFGMMFFGMSALVAAFGAEQGPAGLPLMLGFFPAVVAIWASFLIVPWLYHALFESSFRQATLGKMACGIKVTDLNGNRIGFGRASGRYFSEWITGMTFLIGYLMVAFTEKRQALHDMIAGTVVVQVDTEPARIATALPARQMPGWAIAGIVLAALLPTAGILAAIAIPAFHDYSVRSQVSEGLMLASAYKAGVEDHVAENGNWPKDAATLGGDLTLQADVKRSHYVDSIEIWDGTIVIAYGKNANPRISGFLLSLRPYLLADGEVAWTCGNAMPPDEIADDSQESENDGTDSAIGVTSIVDKYLPASCRAEFRSKSI